MIIFAVGGWIKDSSKREISRLKRDTCHFYDRYSGGCNRYKVICCHNCNGWNKKKDRKKKGNKGSQKEKYRIIIGDKYKMIIETITGIDRFNWILQRCKVGEKIIDIGSQDGHTFNGTSFAGYVTSIDLDKYDFPGFIQMDAHDLKFPDNEFDVAILGEILEHVINPVQVMKEANRVAKRVLMTMPNEYEWDKSLFPFRTIEESSKAKNMTIEELARDGNKRAIEFDTEDGYKHLWHVRYYTEDKIRKDLEDAGIKDYRLEKLNYDGWSFFVVDTDNSIDNSIYIDNMMHISGTTGQVTNIEREQIITCNGLPIERLVTTNSPCPDPGYGGPCPGITYGTDINIANILSSKGKLRIALISTPFFGCPPTKYGGLETVVWDLAEGLDELGHTVTLFAPEGSKTPKHGVLVNTGPALDTVNVNWYKMEENRYFKWKDIVTNDRYDVVCGHDWFGFEYFHRMNNLKLKVCHCHHGGYIWDTAPPFPKPNLIAISKFMRDYTVAYFKQKGFNVDCRFVWNGINLDRYSFDPLVEKTNRLLYVGRFSAFKQPLLAMRLAIKLGLSLDMIGGSFVEDPNYMNQIEKMCEGKDISMFKDVTHEFKIKKMQEAKVVIIPSKMNEPLNLVSIEAQACGTAVIVTRDGGLPETVNHGVTGFVCDTEQEMEEAIGKIDTIKSSDCRKWVEENFSRQRMAVEYEKLFYQIVRGEDW